MKEGLHVTGRKGLLGVLACALMTGCTGSSFAGTSEMMTGASQSQAESAGDACPSQDFTLFLQRYADAADDGVRRRFTADPLEYEVPTHTVEDETESSPPTRVYGRNGSDRLDLFPYRYFRDTRAFGRIVPGSDTGFRQGQAPYPVAITVAADGGRKVVFGTEYEIDIYIFKRSRNCWRLARAVNPRD